MALMTARRLLRLGTDTISDAIQLDSYSYTVSSTKQWHPYDVEVVRLRLNAGTRSGLAISHQLHWAEQTEELLVYLRTTFKKEIEIQISR